MRKFDGAGDEGIEQRIEHREPEDRIARQPLVVLDPDEFAGTSDLGVGEGNPDAEAKRIGQEEDQERHRRHHEPEAEPVAVGPHLIPRRGLADRRPGSPGLEGYVSHGEIPQDIVRRVAVFPSRMPRRAAIACGSSPRLVSGRCASTAVRSPRSCPWHPRVRCSSWRTCRRSGSRRSRSPPSRRACRCRKRATRACWPG